MKLSKIFKKMDKIKIGDIIFDETTTESNEFRYCKVSKIDINYFWGYWYKTLENIKNNLPCSDGTLPSEKENCVKI